MIEEPRKLRVAIVGLGLDTSHHLVEESEAISAGLDRERKRIKNNRSLSRKEKEELLRAVGGQELSRRRELRERVKARETVPGTVPEELAGTLGAYFGKKVEVLVEADALPNKTNFPSVLSDEQGEELTEHFRKLGKENDLVIAIGRNHSRAYPLYAGGARVARFDAHTDARPYDHEINCGNYVDAVIRNGLTEAKKITHYTMFNSKGKPDIFLSPLGEFVDVGKLPLNHDKEHDVVDVDVDVLHSSYDAQSKWESSNLTSTHVLRAVNGMKEPPKVLGFFEYRPEQDAHGFAKDLLVQLSRSLAQRHLERIQGFKPIKK